MLREHCFPRVLPDELACALPPNPSLRVTLQQDAMVLHWTCRQVLPCRLAT
jgi:hypothetical protein